MTDPPIWYLDVDGVLNAVTNGTPPMGFIRGEASPGEAFGAFPICWHPEIIKGIVDMHEAGVVEVKWLTTWGRAANDSLRELLDMPVLDVASDPYDHIGRSSNEWWKLVAVRDLHDEERRYVWTDDDLAYEPEARAWAWEQGYLMYWPKTHRGLTFEMLAEIREWAEKP